MQLIKTYINEAEVNSPAACKLYRIIYRFSLQFDSSEIFYNYFEYFINIYNITSNNKSEFFNLEAYFLYYAYQTKKLKSENLKKVLNNFYCVLKTNNYENFIDFTLLNCYRGMIFLSLKVKN